MRLAAANYAGHKIKMSEMAWIRVITLPGSSDFSALNQWLSNNGVIHRFTLEGNSQILWVKDEKAVEPVRLAASEWLKEGRGVDGTIGVARHLKSGIELNQPITPLTIVLLFLSLVGFALVSIGIKYGHDYYSLFLYYERVEAFTQSNNAWYLLKQGEIWRAITPIFLHFGAMHIVFNAIWLWFLGSRIELVYGAWPLALITLFIALVSNSAQAWVSFPTPFGGMSGVVYGLFAYVWIVGVATKIVRFQLPPALPPIMIIFMLISWLGVFDTLAGGEVADTAHTVGFASGLLCAGITIILVKKQRKDP